MDAPTLDWIAANAPPAVPGGPALAADEILLLVPDETWFAEPRLADSLHGVRHGARTCVLAFLLAREYRLDRQHTAALCTAAAVHDCQRHDDRADPDHGQRGAAWFAEHAEAVLAAFDQDVSPELRAAAATAIAVHNLPYDAFSPEHTAGYERTPHLVDLLKAADCLDRYRLPLERWWPAPVRLRVELPSWLGPFAHSLVVHSERARLDGAGHRDALSQALATLIEEETRP
ncbi:hypothetical protein FE633_11085 [Streptomyces montanus]|uniref:HD domain-containing protein n=2 Tax=Streptomyces montanus TaxID=2580423 RepID=A0A5R9FQJ2_9ACTN|nr:hypothetical protein FE633_11085 [Streptomyces montanus]